MIAGEHRQHRVVGQRRRPVGDVVVLELGERPLRDPEPALLVQVGRRARLARVVGRESLLVRGVGVVLQTGTARVVLRVALLRGVGVLVAGEEGHRNSGAGASGPNRYAHRRPAHSRGIPACPHPLHRRAVLPRPRPPCPTTDQALPGRPTTRSPCPRPTSSTATRSRPPFPDGLETAVFGLGCFWGAERGSGRCRASTSTAVGYAGGFTPNPTYEEVCSGRPATPRPCWWSSTRRGRQLRAAAARSSGRATTRPRACARATTSAPSTARRSTTTDARAAAGRRGVAGHVPGAAARDAGYGEITTEIAPAGPVLLRRGLPPAVPGQEPDGYCGLGGTGVSCPIGLFGSGHQEPTGA